MDFLKRHNMLGSKNVVCVFNKNWKVEFTLSKILFLYYEIVLFNLLLYHEKLKTLQLRLWKSWMDINSRVKTHEAANPKRVAQTSATFSFSFHRTSEYKSHDRSVPLGTSDCVDREGCIEINYSSFSCIPLLLVINN